MYNNKYVVEKTLAGNLLCKLKIASVLGGTAAENATEPKNNKVVLKVWKKQVLRAKKEYHRKKGGHGMVATDQLMKVMGSEVAAMLRLSQGQSSPNVVRLLEIIDDEAGFEDKLVMVMEFCPGGQLLTWDPETH